MAVGAAATGAGGPSGGVGVEMEGTAQVRMADVVEMAQRHQVGQVVVGHLGKRQLSLKPIPGLSVLRAPLNPQNTQPRGIGDLLLP
jgi:hypothetical protein